jgi:hypothetical protein
MRIMFINNDGGGFADYIEIEPGTTVSQLFSQRLPGQDPAHYHIRINRQPAPRDQVLQEDDRISITPTKIAGAGGDHDDEEHAGEDEEDRAGGTRPGRG